MKKHKLIVMSKAFRLVIVGLLLLTLGLASGVAYGQDQGDSTEAPVRIFVEVDRPAGQPPIRIPSNIPANAPKAANITVTYTDGAGCTHVWGDGSAGTARAAFEYAVGIWEATLTSAVEIRVDVAFASLPGNQLGGMGGSMRSNWAGAPISNVWFMYALADRLNGADLSAGNPDIAGEFDCDADRDWYFGTDANPGATEIDFVTVVLHELAHGVGFLGLGDVTGGLGTVRDTGGFDRPSIWDCYTATDNDGTGDYLVNTAVFPDDSAVLATALTSNNVYFHGAQAMAANANAPVELYAPAAWNPGSSYSHLGESFNATADALMTWSISSGESQHTIGSVILGVLNDTGWDGSVTNGGEACKSPTAVRVQSLTASSATPALAVVWGICAVLLLGVGAVIVRRRF
jgi:predicted membrane protein